MRSTLPKALAAAALAVCLAGSVQAATLSLTDLFGGGSLVAGDKQFDRFSLVFQDTNDPTRLAPVDTDKILVSTLSDGGDNPGPGLNFSVIDSEFSLMNTTGLYTYLDFSFSFRVSVLDPGKRIAGAQLALDTAGAILGWTPDGSNDSGVYIKETLGTGPLLADLGDMEVEFSVLDDVQTAAENDAVATGERSELWVTKNALIWATDRTDFAGLTSFSQRFSQTQVPEPSSFALVGLALLAAGVTGRSRRQR